MKDIDSNEKVTFRRHLWWPLLCLVLVAVLLLGVARSWQTTQQLHREWVRDHELLWQLRMNMGYGGFIHNFKNYVLREEESYAVQARQNFHQIQNILAQLSSRFESEQARRSLAEIRATFVRYFELLTEAEPGVDISVKDRRVRVNDEQCLQALATLQALISDRRLEVEAKSEAAFWELMALMMLSLVALVGGLWWWSRSRAKWYERERQAAQESEQSKAQFLATLSHEIRTPMNGVLGASTLLLDTDLNEQQLQWSTLIHDSTRLLIAVLNDVLDFSKIEAGKISLEHIPMNLGEIINNVVRLHENGNTREELALRVDFDSSVRSFYGDPARWQQILMNLVSNAVKFTLRGSVSVSCRLENGQSGRPMVALVVADTGIGIAEDQLNHIFDRFTQADDTTTRNFGGSGLGLAIVKQLVELMGGCVDVQSRLGEGSTFTVRIPVELDGGSSATQPEGLLRRDYGLTAIMAEDSPTNQLVACAMLKKYGVRVIAVESGLAAIDLVNQGQEHDLILMDIHMPDLDGIEATKRLRASGYAKPIVALTANVLGDAASRYRDAGMNRVLAKPLEPKAFVELFDEMFTERGKTRG